jgi:hypothetical protein
MRHARVELAEFECATVWFMQMQDEASVIPTEVAGNPDPCLANVGPSDEQYESCGERLRKRNNQTKYCPTHGPMH